MKKIKLQRFISLTLAVVMMLGLFAIIQNTASIIYVMDKTGNDGTTNWDFIEPVTHQKTVPDGYIGIYTAQDLDNVRNNLSGNYILMNDIDLSLWGDWEAIGSGYTSDFKGIFDGNNYVITGLIINEYTVYQGLFGYSHGSIRNLILEDIDIKQGHYIGGIVGYNYGTVSNCHSYGEISGYYFVGGIVGINYGEVIECDNSSDISGNSNVGGIVGENNSLVASCYNYGNITGEDAFGSQIIGGIAGENRMTIIDCANLGDIIGHANVGGIVGRNSNEMTSISYCINSGTINGIGSGSISNIAGVAGQNNRGIVKKCTNLGIISRIGYGTLNNTGGIIGTNSGGTVENCINQANINGDYYSGGIVGSNQSITTTTGNSSIIINGEIKNCINSGDINGSSNIGGIVGYIYPNSETIHTNCIYLSGTVNGGNDSNTIPGVKAISNMEMRQQSSFIGFDFETVWEIDPNINNGYPYLRTFSTTPTEPQETTITLSDSTYFGEVGEQITISGTFSSSTLAANVSTITWSCNDETAVTFGQMSVLNTLEETIISIPVTFNKAGTYTVTVKSNDGEIAQATVIVNRVNFDTDRWNFINPKGKGHEIPKQFFYNVWGVLKGSALHAFDDGTKGQCYGMASAAATINDNLPKVNSFENVFEDGDIFNPDLLMQVYPYFYNNEIAMTAGDFIKYGQLMTQSNEMSKQRRSTINKLNELYKAVKDFQNGTGDPVIIDIRGGIGQGHALYALRIENDISEGCNIIVYDCNYSYPKKLYLLKENDSFNKWAYEFDEENGVFWGSGQFANYITYTTPSSLLYDKVKLVSNKNISRSTTLNSIDSNLLLVSDVVLEQSNLIPIMSYNSEMLSYENNSEVKNYYWVEDKKTLSFSTQENPLNLTLADSYSGISATVGANANIILNVADNIKNSAKINTTNNSEVTISNLFAGKDENINSITINGISSGNVELLETENGIFFTGADTIAIIAEIDGKEISQEFADVTSDDYIKVVLSNDNDGIEIITLDYNPFETTTIIKGDLNSDGIAGIADAQLFLEYLVGNYELSDTQLLAAKDFTGQSALKSLRTFLDFVMKN